MSGPGLPTLTTIDRVFDEGNYQKGCHKLTFVNGGSSQVIELGGEVTATKPNLSSVTTPACGEYDT